MNTFRNPVLAGLNPDPSVCAVGEDFYLVTSSFAYFPAIPVHHSRDLVHWEAIGHVLDRPEQIDLSGLQISDGIWAPTIRHHSGVFYVVSTVAVDRRGSVNFITTAADADGPWSQPVVLEAEGIDPSLFFDDDGRCWFTACRDAKSSTASGPAELYLQELDLQTLQLMGPLHVLWSGAVAGAWAEAPHIYKRGGIYHLVAAEGGTERNHAVTAARSRSVTGPYVTDPRSPLLTHRHHRTDATIQNVGHADVVETSTGEAWALVLGIRPVDGVHTLGREVFLLPAEWTEEGLLLAPEHGRVSETERSPFARSNAVALPGGEEPSRESFPGPGLPPGWRSLRGPLPHPVTDTSDGLRLTVSMETLSGRGTPSFVARRQEHQCFEARALVSFSPMTSREQAGLVVFHDEDHFAAVAVSQGEDGGPVVRVFRSGASGTGTGDTVVLHHDGDVLLRVIGDRDAYMFSCWDEGGGQWLPVGSVPRVWFSTEHAGGFVGVHLGVHATGATEKTSNEARFRWFEYMPVTERDAETGDSRTVMVGRL